LRFSIYIFFFFGAEAKTTKREVGRGTLVVYHAAPASAPAASDTPAKLKKNKKNITAQSHPRCTSKRSRRHGASGKISQK